MSLLVSRALRKPYDGLGRKLIIAFDVGTTFSGVSYALLIPREPPLFQGVTQFPGQQKVGGDSKIPSVVCYDQSGNVVAVGPETDIDTNPELLEVEGLVRAEWFKLHLRPPHLAAEQRFNANSVPPLPSNKTVVDIFGDLLAYLHTSTKQYIRERQGQDILESIGRNIEYVLSHPNGWEGQQQSVLRRAAIIVGLVANESEASERITFVTEGEATLHFCLNKVPTALENVGKDGILIVDCGGGTIDLSTYARGSDNRYKEIAPAECLLQGSFFVTQRAQEFLTKKLAGSEFGNPDDIDIMARYFDKTTKPNYKGNLTKPVFIRFGSRESDPEFGIMAGSVKVDGVQIARFFEPAITSIIKAVEGQIRNSSIHIKTIFMAGGFATSDYLFSKLDEHFKRKKINILRPDAYLNKAVAEGAVLFKVDHAVTTRVAKYTYGVEMSCPYDREKPGHYGRRKKCFSGPSGERFLPNVFSIILEKGTEVSEEGEFRKSYINEYSQVEFKALNIETMVIKCYRGRGGGAPAWIDDSHLFPDLCVITADLGDLKKTIKPQFRGKKSRVKFYEVQFDVILFFGLTELKAQIAWMQHGVERRGPASIVYDVASQAVVGILEPESGLLPFPGRRR